LIYDLPQKYKNITHIKENVKKYKSNKGGVLLMNLRILKHTLLFAGLKINKK
jgi:hypothetical protein